MKTLMRRVLLVLLLAAPLAANAEVLSIRLEQPAKGATLTGGSTATIAWSATSLDSEVEEWEAFLSVDGGRYYGARITPHLDASIREFRWTVPNVSSRDARILLRFGNEKNERVVELPVSLKIEAAAPPRVGAAAVTTAGEPARPGDPGVAVWAESDRRGTRLTLVTSSIPVLDGVEHSGAGEPWTAEWPGTFAQEPPADAGIAIAQRRSPARSAATPLSSDVLLQCSRLNI
jgi:hypothetical protein